jgi:two-component system, NarL family, nitrate/nitrite response regulator NarL
MVGAKSNPSPLSVAVVEDDPLYRESLETLLRHARGFVSAGVFRQASDALHHLERAGEEGNAWSLILMDLDLPGMNGIEATRRVKLVSPETLVVILTVFEEPATILEAICAGADGYLLKKVGPQELLAQLQVVAAGGAPLTSRVARSVLNLLRHQEQEERSGAPWPASNLRLTEREREVLGGLVRGLAYKQVGFELGISLDTVRHHIRGIYGKLQVHSVSEAVSRAIRERLV